MTTIGMKTTTGTHAAILGGGVIGLALARELAAHKLRVTVVDPQPPAMEASWAAAGMLAPDSEKHPDRHFRALQSAGRDLYPEYVAALEKESGRRVGFRTEGLLVVTTKGSVKEALREPELIWQPALFFPQEYSVDNRLLTAALMESCRKHGVQFVRAAAERVERSGESLRVFMQSSDPVEADIVINAAGCWAGQIDARGGHHHVRLDIRPLKGQIAAVRAEGWKLRYTVRNDHVYLVPRDDGRIIVGATMEEAGYDKSVDPRVIKKLLETGAHLVPKIRNAPLVESWAGLRPATRTGLPLIGETKIPGYYVAVGHLRNGILLAPITAKLLGQVIRGGRTPDLLKPFVP
jgi:glycine oxidase